MRARHNVTALIMVTTFLLNVLCKKHIESVHDSNISYYCSIWDHNCCLKYTMGKIIESIHDNMTSCHYSICGHNFILKSNHNYSLKSTLKKYIESVCENKTPC